MLFKFNHPSVHWLVLAAWAALVSAPIALLMAQHLAPLPAPTSTPAWPATGRWRSIHVLGGDCTCSADLAEALRQRGPDPALDEEIWMVGDAPWSASLQRAGFKLRRITEATLQNQQGLEGAPWLYVIDPQGHLAYSGGHTGRPAGQRAPLRDIEICGAVRSGQAVASLPAYGCAVSDALRARLDPFRLKYPSAATRP